MIFYDGIQMILLIQIFRSLLNRNQLHFLAKKYNTKLVGKSRERLQPVPMRNVVKTKKKTTENE